MKRALLSLVLASTAPFACGNPIVTADGSPADSSPDARALPDVSPADVIAPPADSSLDASPPDSSAPIDALAPLDSSADATASPLDVVNPPLDAPPPPRDVVSPPADVPATDAPASGPVIPPGDPGAGDVTFTVHTQLRRQPISRFVYGTNSPAWATTARGLTLGRIGGNRWTAYNWENNASNAGTDYMNQNDGYLSSSDVPGEAVRVAVAAAHAAGAAELVTVPIVGYVAADKGPGGDVNRTANYLMTRFHVSSPRKGSALSRTPDLRDARVYQDEFVSWLEGTFPVARTDPNRTVFYSLDNEPDLWPDTHPRVHPARPTYAEMVTRTVEYASAIKSVAPDALVFGPVNYGYAGYVNLQDAPDARGRDFLDFFLDASRDAERTAGRRLLDVLDVHWYPEARGDGQRITGTGTSAGLANARVQAPRSLWDPTYTEDSWISRDAGLGAIRLVPRLLEKIRAHYPGTRLAITEYNYGGGGHISGGVAQADALGVFGREGVFAACLWELNGAEPFNYGAFAMYRNYDGAGAAFGDTSVSADTSAVAQAAVYASVDASGPDRVVLVAINRATRTLNAAVRVSHTSRLARAEAFQLTAMGGATPRAATAPVLSATNAFRYALPAMSVTTIVLRP